MGLRDQGWRWPPWPPDAHLCGCCPPSPRSAAQTALPGRRADPCHHGGPRAASTEPRTHTHSRQSRFWWGPGNLTATLPVQNEGKLAKMNQMVSEWILLKAHKVGRGFRPLVSCASFGWHLTVSVTNQVQIVKGRLSRGVVKVLGERNSKHSNKSAVLSTVNFTVSEDKNKILLQWIVVQF